MSMRRMIFLRHGQDHDERRGGWSGFGLVEEGKMQALKLAEYFRRSSEYRISYILSSDLIRAAETAEYVAEALEMPIHKDERLRETNNGELAGMLNSEALEKYPGLFWNTLGMNEPYPKGESPAEFFQRIKTWFYDVLNNPPIKNDDILVVTHGGVINVIYHLANQIEWTNKNPSFPISKCSIHVLNMDTLSFDTENLIVWKQ